MSAAEKIPWELRAIGAEEVGLLLGLSPRTVLETVACREDFPVRLSMRPATWVAGEVLAWRACPPWARPCPIRSHPMAVGVDRVPGEHGGHGSAGWVRGRD